MRHLNALILQSYRKSACLSTGYFIASRSLGTISNLEFGNWGMRKLIINLFKQQTLRMRNLYRCQAVYLQSRSGSVLRLEEPLHELFIFGQLQFRKMIDGYPRIKRIVSYLRILVISDTTYNL